MIIAAADSLKSLKKYKEAGADAVIVSIPFWSIKNNAAVPLEEVPAWTEECRRLGLQLYVNLQRFVMEEELPEARRVLEYLRNYVNGIYYGDEGILQLAKELGMKEKLIYSPETLVTSSLDAAFYMEQGILSICLANELSLAEIQAIASRVPCLEILVQGYSSSLYSRRLLVSNYLSVIGKEKEKDRYDLIEQTRSERMPVVENAAGTIVFTSQPKTSAAQLTALQNAGLNRFRIDNLFAGDEKAAEWIRAYRSILDGNPAPDLEGSDAWYQQESHKRKEEAGWKK